MKLVVKYMDEHTLRDALNPSQNAQTETFFQRLMYIRFASE